MLNGPPTLQVIEDLFSLGGVGGLVFFLIGHMHTGVLHNYSRKAVVFMFCPWAKYVESQTLRKAICSPLRGYPFLYVCRLKKKGVQKCVLS